MKYNERIFISAKKLTLIVTMLAYTCAQYP